MVWVALVLMVLSGAMSWAICAGVIWMSRRQGWLDHPGSESHKGHAVSVPNTGGVGVFWAMTLPMIGAILVGVLGIDSLGGSFSAYAEGLSEVWLKLLWVVLAMGLLHVLGMVDDRVRLSAGPKLIGQLAAAACVVILADVRALVLLEDMWGVSGYAVSVILTVLWIVAVCNAINFMDNMDGLCSGVAGIVGLVLTIMALLAGQWFVAFAGALVVGSCLGFLIWNRPPARLFMGDGGSLVLGFVLAIVSIETTYLSESSTNQTVGGWWGVVTPLVVLAVPMYDLITVSIIRLRQGKHPWVGDQQHLSHRLARGGLGRVGAVLAIWLCTWATAAGGLMLPGLGPIGAVAVGLQTLGILAVIGVLDVAMSRATSSPSEQANAHE